MKYRTVCKYLELYNLNLGASPPLLYSPHLRSPLHYSPSDGDTRAVERGLENVLAVTM